MDNSTGGDKPMKKLIYVLLQCTWGAVMTIIGLFVFLANAKCEHQRYRCCIDTKWNSSSGMSLGLFTFTPRDDVPFAQQIRVHEYGHTIQNLVLGPLMIIVAIISVIWGNLPYYARLRKEKQLPYTSCFVEGWASRWGELVTKEEAI